MSSRNPSFVSRTNASSASPTSQETKTHEAPSKQQENPVEETPNGENPQLLLPESTKQEIVDAVFLISLLSYKRSVGPLPSFDDADFINSNRNNRGFVNEARLRERVLKLHTRYKETVEEKGRNPSDEDFSTYNEYLIFELSRKVWEKELEANVGSGS